METKLLLLCKKSLFCEYAIKIAHSYFPASQIVVKRGNVGTAIDEELHWHKPDYIISFLSPWIVPEYLLRSAQKAAINFHPGSPRYPGSGCYNFAIYEKSKSYGVTCHHMQSKVDTGKIIMTSYFDISPNETVETLKLKSMNHLLFIFEKVISSIYTNDSLPTSDEKWECTPYTKKQLDDLCKIDLNKMAREEIELRIRATTYSPAYKGVYIETNGIKFYKESEVDEPIV